MKKDARDVAVRALKTFLEAAAAFVMAKVSGAELFAMDGQMWQAIAISAMAAGLSAVWNGVIEPAIAPALPEGVNQNSD